MIGLVDVNNCFVSCERVFNRSLVGRPVAVLSNNDGCCVARSNEFKALGIAMGTPYFQLKDREKSGELVFCSSNYELYGDMSRRLISILRDEALDVEQYSIDEAFILPPVRAAGNGEQGTGNSEEWFMDYGKRLRAKILRWIGLPCGIGFAPTKTLAKIADHIAKKRTEGVFVLPDDPTDILADLPSDEVWGVGRRLVVKLRAERIFTAKDLRDARDDVIRSVGGVTLLRTAQELRGIPSNEDRDYDADPDSVSCSRSFGEPVTTLEGLAESLASFTAQAATKLRKHGLLASGCNVYAQIFHSGGGGDFLGRTVMFPAPTDATNEMLKAIREEVDALYIPGTRYRKTGVVFFGLEKVGSARQLDLFSPVEKAEASPLYKAIDSLNKRYGKGKVFSAAEGLGDRSWKMKRGKLSKRPTTRWDELMVVR
ncbi:MAG: Y-family DNA polymerase [Kiritimatiellae bacterium]|nr:Y-family DNA polymerase [Kiritimatiellia bacterium]